MYCAFIFARSALKQQVPRLVVVARALPMYDVTMLRKA